MRVLVIAAHPDDEVLGCGGTIAKHIENGDDVYIYILGEGVVGRHGPGVIEEIRKHSIDAAKILGVPGNNVSFGGFLIKYRFDTTHLTELIISIEAKMNEVQPQIVYTHFHGDANSDHGLVYRATMSAVRPIAISNKQLTRVLCYEVPSSTDQSFQLPKNIFCPNVFNDITNHLDIKIKSMQCYKSEIQEWPHPRSNEGIVHLAKYRGMMVKRDASEAFMLMREVI